jgi:hypothetical protein
MRDWWYQQVVTRFGGLNPEYQALEQKLDGLLMQLAANHSVLADIKSALRKYTDVLVDQVDADNAPTVVTAVVNIPKPPFLPGSPCQMAGQPCPVCSSGVMDIDVTNQGVQCTRCGLFVPVAAPQ